MDPRALFFSLIGEEIFGIPCHDAVDPSALLPVFELAKKQDLAHILATPLEKRGFGNATDSNFQKQQITAIYRYELNRHELESICRVLTEAEIPHMLLKGTVIRDLYPQPYLRTSCDIDLLVKQCHLSSAAELLTDRLGYRPEKKPALHDLSLHSKSGVHLELHFSLKEHSNPMDSVLERVWAYAVLREGMTYVQDDAFLVFHTVAHMAYHFSHGGCGIKPVIDLHLLRKKLNYDETKLLSLLREAELEAFYTHALLLGEVWFGGKTHTPLTNWMENYLLQGGVYGSTENHVALGRQRAGGKLRYTLRRIWMPREQLQLRYPQMKKSALLIPWYQVRRWVETVFGGRLKNAAVEMRATRRISEDASARTDKMMKELGL